MRELSLHILDIIQNSIAAEANLIKLTIKEDKTKDQLLIKINDNGSGMTGAEEQAVLDPFFTSRTTRDVGLGLPLFKRAAERCGGSFSLDSELNQGTTVVASFGYSHLDRAPLGDIVGTITSILASNPELDLIYTHQVQEEKFEFNTQEIKAELEAVRLNQPQILNWINDYLEEKLADLRG